jgi:hypothetical protein
MLMSTAVSQLAEKTPGKESVAIESFARALRQVIKQIFILLFSMNRPSSYQQLSLIMLVMIVLN